MICQASACYIQGFIIRVTVPYFCFARIARSVSYALKTGNWRSPRSKKDKPLFLLRADRQIRVLCT